MLERRSNLRLLYFTVTLQGCSSGDPNVRAVDGPLKCKNELTIDTSEHTRNSGRSDKLHIVMMDERVRGTQKK